VHTPVAGLIARVAARIVRIPIVVYTAHGFYFHDQMPRWKQKIFIWLEVCMGFYTDFLFDKEARNLAKNGVAFHARSIFHQGTLLNTKTLPSNFKTEIKNYDEYCKEHGLTSLQGALSIFDSQNLFKNLVIGVSNAKQLGEIIQSPVTSINSMLDEVPTGLPKQLTDPRLWTTK
jgi:hypothetical protein